MKKIYTQPSIKVVELESDELIATSFGMYDVTGGKDGKDPDPDDPEGGGQW